jgi:pimeloyl-ACP methyl ester carboxylesterase
MHGPAVFLSGDSYPRNPHVEDALSARLAPSFSRWIGQSGVLRMAGVDGFTTNVPQRLFLLDRVLSLLGRPSDVVLIGRSSGARVASTYAEGQNVAAVVCLGYPFREPGRFLEPSRFLHLAETKTPTLVVQGVEDPFGGLDLTEHYALSPSVRVNFVGGAHEFHLSSGDWDAIAARIAGFCSGVREGRAIEREPFDERFYLHAHPDVAEAVSAGYFVSGEDHFTKHGLQERRTFRLMPRLAAT